MKTTFQITHAGIARIFIMLIAVLFLSGCEKDKKPVEEKVKYVIPDSLLH